MFDIGWSEMAIIFLIALIIIGPKDLPRVARTVGKWTGKARAMARDFQRSIDDMAREAELDEIKKTINKARTTDVGTMLKETVDPEGEIEAATDMSELNEVVDLTDAGIEGSDEPVEPRGRPKTKPQTVAKPMAKPAGTPEPVKNADSTPADPPAKTDDKAAE